MDFVKNALNKAQSGNNAQQGQAQGGQQEDYVDKAVEFAGKKSGHSIDRNTEEKLTDSGRSAYEKATGSTVNPKISN